MLGREPERKKLGGKGSPDADLRETRGARSGRAFSDFESGDRHTTAVSRIG